MTTKAKKTAAHGEKSKEIPKPKLKIYPESPDPDASLTAWKRWEDRCAKVAAFNKSKKDAYQRKKDEVNEVKKAKASIRARVRERKSYKPKAKVKKRTRY